MYMDSYIRIHIRWFPNSHNEFCKQCNLAKLILTFCQCSRLYEHSYERSRWKCKFEALEILGLPAKLYHLLVNRSYKRKIQSYLHNCFRRCKLCLFLCVKAFCDAGRYLKIYKLKSLKSRFLTTPHPSSLIQDTYIGMYVYKR